MRISFKSNVFDINEYRKTENSSPSKGLSPYNEDFFQKKPLELPNPYDEEHNSLEGQIKWVEQANLYLKNNPIIYGETSTAFYNLLDSNQVVNILIDAQTQKQDDLTKLYFQKAIKLAERLCIMKPGEIKASLTKDMLISFENYYNRRIMQEVKKDRLNEEKFIEEEDNNN